MELLGLMQVNAYTYVHAEGCMCVHVLADIDGKKKHLFKVKPASKLANQCTSEQTENLCIFYLLLLRKSSRE